MLKDIVNLPETWLSARLRKVAAREAIDMIQSVKQRWKNKPSKIKMPIHKGKRMCCSSTIADLQLSKNTLFDAWLHLSSIGNKTIINIPIKYHRQFNKWNNKGWPRRLEMPDGEKYNFDDGEWINSSIYKYFVLRTDEENFSPQQNYIMKEIRKNKDLNRIIKLWTKMPVDPNSILTYEDVDGIVEIFLKLLNLSLLEPVDFYGISGFMDKRFR